MVAKKITSAFVSTAIALQSCNTNTPTQNSMTDDFQWEAERFADIRILRYQIPEFDSLSVNQKLLVYYLVQAGLSGRDIIYDQNHRYNLTLRHCFDKIISELDNTETDPQWSAFEEYVKRFWFSNGAHHHYSHQKFQPGFSRDYFLTLLKKTHQSLPEDVLEFIFNPNIEARKVVRDEGSDPVLESAVNFYEPGITTAEAENFYKAMMKPDDPTPPSYGLNSKLVRLPDGSLAEKIWKVGGMYGAAIEKIVYWLEKATEVAENEKQKKALQLLIEYYKTGDLRIWDQYNIAWVQATDGAIDYINSFIEVYNDPIGYKANYESIVQIEDFQATKRMRVLSENANWFEKNSPIDPIFKKERVVGISYRVVHVAGEAGDASPATPIGVNLPNADWIRVQYGSKSVSLGNIEDAYEKAGLKPILEEFCFTTAELERALKYGGQASKLHTALHEVIGHASGQPKPGINDARERLSLYYSTIEEARADLVALYFITDPYLLQLGLIDSPEIGKAEYDSYIRNGLMLQLRRLKPGEQLEEDHMRNRQLIAKWLYEHGKPNNIIEKKSLNGKTYFIVNDYNEMRNLIGQLLREIQRIKSEGDFAAAKRLVELYGVKVDQELHAEVLRRTEALNIPPYAGFINPKLVPVELNGKIVDIKVEYPTSFKEQMLEYGRQYSFLPLTN
ncbi:dipeptidyl-peptidase 3 family protein [Schleiferia thermophila]|jgi:dipeptidyl-peptidase-3|uniref:Dipeptidyl-peptidase-3 n=1 Tax=Schleiferia thermophila TaxID=884107 RepID=A0A369A1G9_9FLAO|nr:dihydrofolate reductase [Schleiferia thermophila]KFD39255.1 dihydrofolate reductase [Schleiferia thermophila str. Yellowstone]RCX03140.1 dipeptidyl-peptidase-3 [Schleiferia thermophila]GCD80269.1 dihydrofolate reductase [Schleiferia thermophila]